MPRSEPDRPSGPSRRAGTLILLFLVVAAVRVAAQPASLPLVLRATTTTSAKVFPNPLSPSAAVRNASVTAYGWYGVAAELLVPLNSEFSAIASVEVLWHLEEGDRPVSVGGTLQTLPVRDGYVVVPVEIGLAAGVPISEEAYRLTISGGFSGAVVSRIQEVAGIRASTDGLPVAVGIFVGLSFEARLWPGVYGHLSTRFRDPETSVTTRYDHASTVVDGRTIFLPTEPMTTRLNVDGLSVSAGLMFDLPRLF